jgi:hypothetical protein
MMKTRASWAEHAAHQRPPACDLAQVPHQVTSACLKGDVKPHVHQLYGADQLPEALVALGSGRTMGKVALQW